MDIVDGLRALVQTVYVEAGDALDISRADTLEERVRRAFDQTGGEVVLVCSRLDFVDSSGLRVLLQLEREAQLRGVRLVLGDPSKCLRQLLTLTGLMSVLDVDDQPKRPVVPGTPLGGFPVASAVPLLS